MGRTGTVEDGRQVVNSWIPTGGAYDAVIDFDATVRDPDNPAFLLRSRRRGAQTKRKPNPPLKVFFSLRPAVFSNDNDVTFVAHKPTNRLRQICN